MPITSPKPVFLNVLISPNSSLEILSLKSANKFVQSFCMAILSPTFVANPQHVKPDSLQMTLQTDVLRYVRFQKKLMANQHQGDASRNAQKANSQMTQPEDVNQLATLLQNFSKIHRQTGVSKTAHQGQIFTTTHSQWAVTKDAPTDISLMTELANV